MRGETDMKHKLIIKSLHDTMLECTCGKWFVSRTGAMTKAEAQKEFRSHVKRSCHGVQPTEKI